MVANKVFFVTSNDSKVITPARVLARHGITVERVDMELPEIQAATVAEVVAHKARAAFRTIGAPVIVNDGSVLIHSLNDFPSPYVKHVNRMIRIQGYLDLMARYPDPVTRRCTVQDASAFVDATRPAPAVFIRTNTGHIASEARGTHIAGRMTLSPIFIPNGYTKTFAEMTEEEYDAYRQRPENEKMYEDMAAAILGTQTTFE
jgi:non-canonical purine NTP pyrophosphatase (RdgB/HAM1 family)